MQIQLKSSVKHLFMLGAGASVDYGLPVWRDLSSLIKSKIAEDKEDRYKYKKEMVAWLDKVHLEEGYSTLDECIQKESVAREYRSNGAQIEDQIFRVIKEIFQDAYSPNEDGWIRKLNHHILRGVNNPENTVAFVNYNYDFVLDDNLFQYSYLPEKHQLHNFRDRLRELSSATAGVLYPHGSLFTNDEITGDAHVQRSLRTMKSGYSNHLDVVSCFESYDHSIIQEVGNSVKLYILGLGGGLEINLSHISIPFGVSEIHVTTRDSKIKDRIVKFLSDQYSVQASGIKVYSSCDELIEKCFPG